MKEAILWSLARRLVGYLGVAGVVGIDSDIYQLVGAAAALGSMAWSIRGKIKAAKS